MPTTEIRILQAADVTDYRRVMLQAYALHPDAFTSSHAERSAMPLTWWEQRVHAGPVTVFGAYLDGELQGVAGVRYETGEKTCHKATLFGMFVRPQARGQGLAQALVLAVLAHARQQEGVLLVQLTVSDGNAPAQALYRRCGFVPYGLEPMAIRLGGQFIGKELLWHKLEREARA